MPFLGQDWRSPGGCWVKSEDGWKRFEFYREEEEDDDDDDDDDGESCSRRRRQGKQQLCGQLQEENKGSEIIGEDCEVVVKKRKKDHFNNNTKTQYFYQEKWIYVHKGSTKELIANSQLTSLSGAAQKNYFNILEKIVRKVLEDQQNPRLIKNLLQDLGSALCILVREVGRCVLVGNINIWVYRMETILNWQHQLNNLQITRQINNGATLSDLPLHMQNSILYRFSDGLDIVSLGQVTSTLHMLSEDRHLWKKLCQYHFAEKQFCRHLILTEKGCVDWKLMYFTLQKYCPKKEQYGDALQFCRHCSILFWKDYHLALLFKDTGHPCTANNPESCSTPVSPQHFIDLFKF
ncbi:F-box only protein 25 isoform X4 [Carcharodon carcharias]|uniref:F-box only protein 25 isoform X4 n=1 Tax=Carcharodon carcharias TaxID=13397 RepID=UPI001B7E0502|nr:F-box only protein 25 isoform X4 [Carcharodon carcharias]